MIKTRCTEDGRLFKSIPGVLVGRSKVVIAVRGYVRAVIRTRTTPTNSGNLREPDAVDDTRFMSNMLQYLALQYKTAVKS